MDHSLPEAEKEEIIFECLRQHGEALNQKLNEYEQAH